MPRPPPVDVSSGPNPGEGGRQSPSSPTEGSPRQRGSPVSPKKLASSLLLGMEKARTSKLPISLTRGNANATVPKRGGPGNNRLRVTPRTYSSDTRSRSASTRRAGSGAAAPVASLAQPKRRRLTSVEQEAQDRLLLDQHMRKLTDMHRALTSPTAQEGANLGTTKLDGTRQAVGKSPNQNTRGGVLLEAAVAAYMTDCHGAKALIAEEGAQIDASKCVALGEGLANATLRVPSFITVQARTSDNQVLCDGGHAVRLRMSGPSKPVFKVQDNRDGTHFVTYVVNVTGKYFVDIFVNTKPIRGSPFTVSASSGEAAASLSKINGLERSPDANCVVAGDPMSFQISSVDENGHPAGTGGGKWFLQLKKPGRPALMNREFSQPTRDPEVEGDLDSGSGPNRLSYTILDLCNGRYQVDFSTKLAGTFDLHVLGAGSAVDVSPYSVISKPAPIHYPSCVVTGGSLFSAPAGSQSVFTVVARDGFNNVINCSDFGASLPCMGSYIELVEPAACSPDTPSLAVECWVDAENGARANSDLQAGAGPGAFLFQYVPKTAGTYLLTVASSAVIEQAQSRAAAEAAHVKLPRLLADTGFVVDDFCVDETGNTTDPRSLSTTPVQVTVTPGDVSVDHCIISEENVGQVTASRTPLLLHMQCVDEFGNFILQGGHAVSATVASRTKKQADLAAVVNDHSDGTYTVAYPSQVADSISVDIRIDGKRVAGSPFRITIQPDCMASKRCVFSGKMVDDRGGICQEMYHVEIISKDQFDNVITDGGEDFTVTMNGPPGISSTNADVVDNQNGTYTASVAVVAAGDYTLAIVIGASDDAEVAGRARQLRGSPLDGLSFVPNVKDGGLALSTVRGAGLQGGCMNAPLSFTISGRDLQRNPVANVCDQFRVTLSGPARLSATVTEIEGESGEYLCEYVANLSGSYSISVMAAGRHVRGSCFAAVITNGAFSEGAKRTILKAHNISADKFEPRASISGGQRQVLRTNSPMRSSKQQQEFYDAHAAPSVSSRSSSAHRRSRAKSPSSSPSSSLRPSTAFFANKAAVPLSSTARTLNPGTSPSRRRGESKR